MPDTPKIQFTPAQAAAIQARGGSLLVSAAAGSGKTRVLVERVVGLITDPDHTVEADSLLIMTFTNAAAAKLRADIATRLAEEVRAHPADVRLRRQQLLLQRASIGTVDAFCLHFVQQHFAALDVPPDLKPPRKRTWPASSRKHWPMCWSRPIRIRISVHLRICMIGDAPTRPPATLYWNCIILAGPYPIPLRRCRNLQRCGRRMRRPSRHPGAGSC